MPEDSKPSRFPVDNVGGTWGTPPSADSTFERSCQPLPMFQQRTIRRRGSLTSMLRLKPARCLSLLLGFCFVSPVIGSEATAPQPELFAPGVVSHDVRHDRR